MQKEKPTTPVQLQETLRSRDFGEACDGGTTVKQRQENTTAHNFPKYV